MLGIPKNVSQEKSKCWHVLILLDGWDSIENISRIKAESNLPASFSPKDWQSASIINSFPGVCILLFLFVSFCGIFLLPLATQTLYGSRIVDADPRKEDNSGHHKLQPWTLILNFSSLMLQVFHMMVVDWKFEDVCTWYMIQVSMGMGLSMQYLNYYGSHSG